MKATQILTVVMVLGLITICVTVFNSIQIETFNEEPLPYTGYRNITAATYLKLREETPQIAAKMISASVGEDYFNRHFQLYHVEVLNSTDGDWFAQVLYAYVLEVGNHTNVDDTSIWFDEYENVVRVEGIPSKDCLMPFNVTEEQAIELAKERIKPTGDYKTEAGIHNIKNYPLTKGLNKYTWVVTFRRVTSSTGYSSTGTDTVVILDVFTGEIYGVDEYAWTATS